MRCDLGVAISHVPPTNRSKQPRRLARRRRRGAVDHGGTALPGQSTAMRQRCPRPRNTAAPSKVGAYCRSKQRSRSALPKAASSSSMPRNSRSSAASGARLPASAPPRFGGPSLKAGGGAEPAYRLHRALSACQEKTSVAPAPALRRGIAVNAIQHGSAPPRAGAGDPSAVPRSPPARPRSISTRRAVHPRRPRSRLRRRASPPLAKIPRERARPANRIHPVGRSPATTSSWKLYTVLIRK